MTWKRGTRNRHFAKNAITFELDQMPGDTGSQTREAKMLNEFLASLSKKDRAHHVVVFCDSKSGTEIMGMLPRVRCVCDCTGYENSLKLLFASEINYDI